MKISHPAAGRVFELVRTVELDITFGEEAPTPTRVEIFRDTERGDLFRCRVWESELFRLTPSFPRDEAGAPAHLTDDTVMVERGIPGSESASILRQPFAAPDCDAALEMVVAELKKFLEHVTGGRAG